MKRLDTRDLYKQQQELQDELNDLEEKVAGLMEEIEEIEDGDLNELEDLKETLEWAEEELKDWKDANNDLLEDLDYVEREVMEFREGVELIPEADFKQYAMEQAEEFSDTTTRDWPFTCIDWDQATDELMQDYSVLTFQGEEYLFRS